MRTDIRLKEIFKKKEIKSFFRAFSYLLNAGYDDLEAFSNAIYYFPDYEFQNIVKGEIDIIKFHANDYMFKIFERDKSEAIKHLDEFVDYCVANELFSGVPCHHIEFSIKAEPLFKFLHNKIRVAKIKTYENIDYNEDAYDLPF